MKNLLKSAAMLCLSVCMFSLYGCSNEDSPTNSDGSFEGLDVTNLKRGDVVGAQYVKNEAGYWVPLKFTPLSEGDFNVEVTNRAWFHIDEWMINEKGKTEKEELEDGDIMLGWGWCNYSFERIGECTVFIDCDACPRYRFQSPYKYDAVTGAFSRTNEDGGDMYIDFYVLGLEKKDGKTYLWTSDRQEVECYIETTKEYLMEEYPYEWDEVKEMLPH